MPTYPTGFAGLIRSGFRPRQAIALLSSFAAAGTGGGGGGGGGPLGVKRAQVSSWTRTAGQIRPAAFTFSTPGSPPGTPPSLINGGYGFDVPAAEAGWYSLRISLDYGFTGGTPAKTLLVMNSTYYNNRQIQKGIINTTASGGTDSGQSVWGASEEIYVPPFANPGFDAADGTYYMGALKLQWEGAGSITGNDGSGDPRCFIDVVRLS